MRKWLLGGAILAATIIVVSALVLNINSLITRNKDYLIGQAEQALGRKITVGDVEATFWSGIGVRLANFAMADDPTYGSEDFVRARDLQVNFKLWPLLKGEVQVKRLILHAPVVRVIRDTTGEFNFSTIGGKDKDRQQKKEAVGKDKRERQPSDASSSAFLVSLVDISGGDLRYIDRRDGTDLQFRQLDLHVEDLDFNQPFSVKLAAAVYADKQNFHVSAKIGPLPASGDWTDVPLAGEVDIDTLDLTRLKAAAPKLRNALSKELDLSGVFGVKDLRFKGTLKDLAVNGDLEGTQGTIRYGKSFHKPAGVPLTLSTEGRYAGNKIAISKSFLKLHTLELASAGDIRLGDTTALNLSVNSRIASLDGWDRFVPGIQRYGLKGIMELQATLRGNVGKGSAPQVQGALTLKSASAQPPDFPRPVENLDTTIKFTGQRADISDMTLSLGKSRIRVAAAIEKFSPLTFSYKMSTPALWPADYKASLSEERKADIIRNLQSEGQFKMAGNNIVYQGKLVSADGTLFNIPYKDLNATLSLADKVANVQNLRVQALSGTVQLQGEYAFKESSPSFAVTSKVDGIDVKELYAALDAKAERDIQGRMNAIMKLSGGGKSWEEIKPSLRGQGEAEVVQGVIYNFNIAESALTGITGIPGLTNNLSPSLRKKYPETFTAKDTEFKELKTLVDVADGRINFKNMRMSAAEFVSVGNGWADFNRKVDSRATLTFSQRLSADLSQSAREIKYLLNNQGQLEIPLSVSGRMPNVKAKPDANFLGQMVQRNFMRRGTDDLQNRFLRRSERAEEGESAPEDGGRKKRSSTEDRIRRGLENLFRR
ncbi:MAG: AsmA family protein [Candidatus Binatia bacterium]